MSAHVLQFPTLPGSPGDRSVEVIKQAFAESGKPMTDAQAREFTRKFEEAGQQIDCETEGMSSDERMDYLIGKMTDALNEKSPKANGNVRHMKVAKTKVAQITKKFLQERREHKD